MSSKGRKIAKNLGKSLRKKFDSDSQTDDLQQRVAEFNLSQGGSSIFAASGDMRSSSSNTVPSPTMAKSTSLSTIDPADPVVVDHSEIITLTHDVKNFSDTLAKLKLLFMEGLDPGDDASVVLQEYLGEVLAVLKGTLQRYPALQSPEIFTAARVLIGKIKAHNQEQLQLDEEEMQLYLDAMDQLALAFSRSVSEYLMGDIVTQQQLNIDTKVKSCDNLAKAAHEHEHSLDKQETKKILTPAELDAILVGLEAGLDLALQRAKAWSRYIRDIITYIEKKSQLELEYAKNLARIAHSMQPALTNEGYLPLQSVFCTALSQDAEFSSNLQASQVVLHTSKFVEPLSSRRSEHDRMRKTVKETWDRELRRMQDTVNNLRKAQALYISRQQELERVRDTLQKADSEKMEKRKRSEEEAMHKSAEAETTYKACVAETNHRQRSLEKTKVDLLGKIREQIHLCDQVIKLVTVEYFSLLHTVWSPVPVQYQTLCESSSGYEAGCQYAEFIKTLPSSASKPCRTDEYSFEAYIPGLRGGGETRKISVHSNGSSGEHIHSNEGSPISSPRRDKYRIPVKAWGQNSGQMAPLAGSDTDSASGSNRSHESSPSSSPHDLLRRQIVSSQSLEELAEEESEKQTSSAQMKRGQMKRTMTVGGDDSLDLPDIMANQRGRRNTMFGVDFQEQVERYKTQVPPIMTKCLAEIERRGVMIKGIYRVSGVKSKVETLCQRFDLNPELVNLEEIHPNVISNVLKLYLRQLPEPLLTFRLYSDFIHMAKENMAGYLSGDKMVERLSTLARKLPPSNFRTCAVLMHHLHRVAAHSDLNQMSSSNLGIVFGPTLLRPLEGTASLASLVDTPHQTRAVELLITHAEAVFGPGDDFQLVPDQTPVEMLEKSADGFAIRVPVPTSSSEPSPEKSPTKEIVEAIPVPASVPSTEVTTATATTTTITTSSVPSSSSSLPAAQVAGPVAVQIEDASMLVTDAASAAPSLEPSAADFSLPGSASPDKYDKVLGSRCTGALVEGRGVNSDSDAASLSSLDDDDIIDDDDDDLSDVMLPDQSQAASSQSHTPLLTPHCIAESKPVKKDPESEKTGAEATAPAAAATANTLPASPKAPLADMDPAPETTMPFSQATVAVVDCGTWPGSGGSGLASLQSSPTIQPAESGRLSPTKGDSRADRFKLEQRKLLSNIKSDPKLGIPREDGADDSLDADDFKDAGEPVSDEVGVSDAKEEQPPLLLAESVNAGESPQSLKSLILSSQTAPAVTCAAPAPLVSGQARSESPAAVASSGKISAGTKEPEVHGASPRERKDGVEKGEAKERKRAERSDSGTKSSGGTGGGDSVPVRSGIRLGTGGSVGSRGQTPVLGKYSGLGTGKARSTPTITTTAATAPAKARSTAATVITTTSTTAPATGSQRRSNTGGVNGGSSSPAAVSTSSGGGGSRSVLSRYPPAAAQASSGPRRPIPSQPPSSTALSRSSSGSPRRPGLPGQGQGQHSFESSLRSYSGGLSAGPSASSSSSSSLASLSDANPNPVSTTSSARARRISGEKSGSAVRDGASWKSGGNGTSVASKSAGSGSRSALGSGRQSAGVGVTGSGKTSSSSVAGSSSGGSGVPKTATTSLQGSVGGGAFKSSPAASGIGGKPVAGAAEGAEVGVGTRVGGLSASSAGVGGGGGSTATSSASSSPRGKAQEKSKDPRPGGETLSQAPSTAGAKDLSSDRTPRFV